MTEIFKMPDIGEGMAEGEIATWLVKVGDEVAKDDPLMEVQNDKLLQEVISPYAGKVTKLFVDEGAVAKVGDPLVEFDGDGSGSAAGDAAPAAETKPAEPTTPAAAAPAEAPAPAAAPAPVATGSGVETASNGNVLAMPAVRQYARQHQIDLSQVTATGHHGHIMMGDVQGAISQPAASAQAASAPAAPAASVPETAKVGRVAMTPVRKVIAKTMMQQGQIPTVTNFDQVEVSKLVAHRKNWKAKLAEKDIKLTYLAYVVKALASVAKQFPEFAATVDMDTNEIVYYDDINVGIAVDTPNGLFVPSIKQADSKSIITIAKEISSLAEKARDGKLTPDDMAGGAITISNLGSARGSFFTPILNPGQAVILGLGSIVKEPTINENDEIVAGQLMDLSVTYDHRLIDGMLAQKGLNALKQMLADPEYMLMEV